MAITLDTVSAALDEIGLKHGRFGDDQIGLAMQTDTVNLAFMARLQEDGEYFDLRTIGLLTCAEDDPALDGALERLAQFNFQYKLVRFGWDPRDGEIQASVCLPLEDREEFSAEQLGTILEVICTTCEKVYPELSGLISHRDSTKRSKSKPAPRAVEASAGRRAATAPASQKSSGGSPGAATQPTGPNLVGIGLILIGIAALLAVGYLFLERL